MQVRVAVPRLALALLMVMAAAAGCAQPTPEVITRVETVVVEREVPVEKRVVETVVVEKQVQVEKKVVETVVVQQQVEKVVQATVVVEKEKEVVKVVTATPLPSSYGEAPELAALVAQGDLPPVEERLPEEPLVVVPVEEVGKYGGDFRFGYSRPSGAMIQRLPGYESILRWTPDYQSIIPNVAKSWESLDGGRTIILNLRKGMRWSDGHPFSADDVLWWYEELLDEELNPSFPGTWKPGGEPIVVRKLDDYTIKISCVAPFGRIAPLLAGPSGGIYKPAHFCKQYFPGYADETFLAARLKEAGVDNWFEAYASWTNPLSNPDVPVIWPWVPSVAAGDDPTWTLDRNPYYWKVDPEGQQYPYLDRMIIVFGNSDLLATKVVAGELTFQDRFVNEPANRPLFQENADKAEIRFQGQQADHALVTALWLNVVHEDPVKRELFANKDFRIALSHALDRQQIIDLVYFGLSTPAQPSPLPESPFYNEQLATQYLDFDLAKANQMLDAIIPNKDSEGVRLMSNGEPLIIVAEYEPRHTDTMGIVADQWAKAGIKVVLKEETVNFVNERLDANAHDLIGVYYCPGGIDPIQEPRAYLPVHNHAAHARPWYNWYNSGGEQGVEPPESVQKQMDIFRQILITPDLDDQRELMAEILQIAADDFWVMGICRYPTSYVIMKKNLRNVQNPAWSSWQYPNPSPLNIFQFFLE